MTLRVVHYADIEATYDDPERIARLGDAIASLRDETTLLLGAGDNVAPGALALRTEGQQALAFFDTIEPDVDTLGNHDFDYGQETLLSVVRQSPQTWLCANVMADEERFGHETGIIPWTVIERAGHRVGLFGLAHPKTAEKSPGARSLSVTDPISAAVDAVERLREQSVDHVVCLSHLGESEDHGLGEVDDLAVAVDIDVICDGHTHDQPRIDRVDGTLVVRTSGEGMDIAELRYDEGWTATHHAVAEFPPKPDIERTFRELRTTAGVDETVATVDEPIDRSLSDRFHGESRLGNFVTDAYRWATGATIGLQHSAGMRGGPALSGDVTVADLISIVPFDMEVVTTTITGTTLRDVLTSGGEIVYPAQPAFWHIHLSGGSVTFDYETRELAAATVDSEPIDSSAFYCVAAPENLVRSFNIEAETESVGLQYELLAEYARAQGIRPTREDRITRHGLETVHLPAE
ncbi:bifunctional metallophosphatase/5'-nucleotidase [Halocatena salina]|uniref:5'-nucleotidase C-terminal domain-containing protein n=1 Tax=Halocatena salina TaxID=2934340 RepID=A0A8T9ZYY9_9EURY|nr:5'-nucleotidase C-terminal domain-containing protein [Halocatena salina]UPM41945.1 5'-nucleotidase C-terminal domain-containing protein [Halocatena salina]